MAAVPSRPSSNTVSSHFELTPSRLILQYVVRFEISVNQLAEIIRGNLGGNSLLHSLIRHPSKSANPIPHTARFFFRSFQALSLVRDMRDAEILLGQRSLPNERLSCVLPGFSCGVQDLTKNAGATERYIDTDLHTGHLGIKKLCFI